MFVSFSWPWSPSAPSGPPSELPRDGASLRALSRGCRSASCSAVRAPLTHVWEGWSATRAYCQGHGGSSSGCAMQPRWKVRPRAASQRASGVPIRVGFQSGALEGPTCTQNATARSKSQGAAGSRGYRNDFASFQMESVFVECMQTLSLETSLAQSPCNRTGWPTLRRVFSFISRDRDSLVYPIKPYKALTANVSKPPHRIRRYYTTGASPSQSHRIQFGDLGVDTSFKPAKVTAVVESFVGAKAHVVTVVAIGVHRVCVCVGMRSHDS